MSSEEVLNKLANHKKLDDFLNQIDFNIYKGLSLEKVFYFIKTGTLMSGMPLDETYSLLREMKKWLNDNSHGGKREGSGRPRVNKNITKVTLSAEEEDILRAKNYAKERGESLQSLFREWLAELS